VGIAPWPVTNGLLARQHSAVSGAYMLQTMSIGAYGPQVAAPLNQCGADAGSRSALRMSFPEKLTIFRPAS
jgi:hypothetical protein